MKRVLGIAAVLAAGCSLTYPTTEKREERPIETTRCLCNRTEIACGTVCEGETRIEYLCLTGEVVSDPRACPAIQLPDAGMNDAAADAGMTDAGGTDAGSNDAAPSVTLRIRSMDPSDFVQVISDPDAPAEVNLSRFSLCAEGGDVPLSSLTVLMEGWIDQLSVRASLGDRDFERAFNGFQELILLMADAPERIVDGACAELMLETRLPTPTQWSRWIQPSVTNAAVGDGVRVDYTASGFPPTRGLQTVFRQESALIAFPDGVSAPEIVVTRDSQYANVGNFRVCGERYQTGSVRSVTLEVTEGMPGGMSFPVRIQTNVTDRDYRWWNLGVRDRSVAEADLLRWEADRPDGLPEDLSWGACLSFNVSLAFVPEGAEFLRISLHSVEADVPVLVRNQAGMVRTLPASEPYAPEPWSRVRFEDPPVSGPAVQLEWSNGFGIYAATHFHWNGDGRQCGETEQFEGRCPSLTDIVGHVSGIDRRFPATLRDVGLELELENLDALRVRLVIEKGAYLPSTQVLVSEILDLQAGTTAFSRILNTALTDADNFSFRVRVFLEDGVPLEDPSAYLAAGIRMRLTEVQAEWGGHALPALLFAPEMPGGSPTAWRPLAYTGPWVVFHSPELWLENNQLGAPIQARIQDMVAQTQVLRSVFFSRYGAERACEMLFTHGTGKQDPVAENISARLSGSTFALFEWTESQAVFRAPSGECVYLHAQSSVDLEVTIGRPTVPTVNGFPLQFKLIKLRAVPEGLEDPEVPVIVRIENDAKVMLSTENPVVGLQVIITQ